MKHLKKYVSILSLLILLILLTITSCTPDAKKEDLICKVSVVSGEGGIGVSSNYEVMSGEKVILKALSESTYRFVNWTVNGEVVSKENPYTATILTTTQFKANFEKDNYKVTVIAEDGGMVKATQDGDVLYGTKVTFTATQNQGYSFVNWTVNGEEVSTENPYTATITEDIEIQANFEETKGIENGHNWVDLGLPSGLKWATCNVGANFPEEYGDYFAWGETQSKSTYNWSTYKYCNGDEYSMTKYCTILTYGTVDNKITLDLEDDAAHVNWGGNWRMPTRAEQDELRNTSNCIWSWTSHNGVKGYKVISKINGNSIFLPAAGYRNEDDGLNEADYYGGYWSSLLGTSLNCGSGVLYFVSSYVGWYYGNDRYVGQSIRAVCP